MSVSVKLWLADLSWFGTNDLKKHDKYRAISLKSFTQEWRNKEAAWVALEISPK